MKELLFKKVKCNGFLKPIKDGRYIAVDQKTLSAAYIDVNTVEMDYNSFMGTILKEIIGDGEVGECKCEGAAEFLKTYMQLVKQDFSGVVVGIKDVIVSAYLVADVFNRRGDDAEYIGVYKEPKVVKRCAIVYYANNRKHIVPLDCIESEV